MKNVILRTKGRNNVVLGEDATDLEIVEPLDSFPHLTEDLAGLKRLRRLAIKAPFGSLHDLDFLVSTPELRQLEIRARPFDRIMDWSGLSALVNLEEFSANDYARCDLSKLATRGLRKLSVYVPKSKGLDTIFSQRKLRSLRMWQFHSIDLSAFAALLSLEELRIRGGRIASLNGLDALVRLRELELVQVGLRSGEQVASLSRLDHLDLSSNKNLQDIAFVAGLHKLKTFLLLDVPRVRTFKPLAGLPLEIVKISAQPADGDVKPLQTLTKLKEQYFHPKVVAQL